jgi:hypothetical protein
MSIAVEMEADRPTSVPGCGLRVEESIFNHMLLRHVKSRGAKKKFARDSVLTTLLESM